MYVFNVFVFLMYFFKDFNFISIISSNIIFLFNIITENFAFDFSLVNIYDKTIILLLQKEPLDIVRVFITCFLLILMHLIIIIIVAGISSLLERKIFASVQRRQGPAVVGFGGILQFVADGIKLAFKEVISPYPATYFTFILAPVIILKKKL